MGNDFSGVDWEGFQKFRSRNSRYRILPDFFSSMLVEKNLRLPMSLCDLGCGDLALFRSIWDRISNDYTSEYPARFDFVDIESSVEAFYKETVDSLGLETNSRYFNMDAVEFIGDQSYRSDSYDLVLISHLLYHVPKDKWRYLLNCVLNSLNRDGVILLTHRTDDSEWWRATRWLENEVVTNSAHRFAEEIHHDALDQLGFQLVGGDALDTVVICDDYDDFLRITEFLYRTEPGILSDDTQLRSRVCEIADSFAIDNKFQIPLQDEVLIVSSVNTTL